MKSLLILLACLTSAQLIFSQSNIQQPTSINADGAAPAASAMLDVQATDKGMLVPRMTSAQRLAIVSPANGLLVFDTDMGGFWFYNGAPMWLPLVSGVMGQPSQITDADGNTKVQTEESPNEDIIRFDLGGTENMVLRKNASGSPRLELPHVLNNTFVGQDAGNSNTTGRSNAAFGIRALYNNTTRSNLVAVGDSALYNNGLGAFNPNHATGNTAIGSKALFTNAIGTFNTATGQQALYSNTIGTSNTATGQQALYSNTIGSYNTAIGRLSMFNNTTGLDNAATGAYSLYSNTSGYSNTANGTSALFANTTGFENTANGHQALVSNTTGNYNTANGKNAMYSNSTGSVNTATGAYSLYSNTSGNSNTANGYNALYSNTTGEANTANGLFALSINSTGNNNTAHGASALLSNTTGSGNTANGMNALRNNTTGNYNTANGVGALLSNTTGGFNTANGYEALYSNTTGGGNTANGSLALNSNTYGFNNTANGVQALNANTTGSSNTAIGAAALYQNTTGNYNTAFGNSALDNFNATTNSYSTSIGNSSGPTANYVNSISIGHDCHSNGTDRAQIGSVFMAQIGGYQPWTTYASDGRFKRQVQENVGGLDFILQLRPVTYTVDYHALEAFKGIEPFEASAAHPGRETSTEELAGLRQMQADKEASLVRAEVKIQSGFIAQEVLQAAEATGYDFDGVNKPEHEKDNYSLAYSQFVVPLVKGMQEQQAMIEELQTKNAAKDIENAALKAQLEIQSTQLQKITAALQGAGIVVER